MALPQTVDPTTLNISGKPQLSTVAPTAIISPGGTGMAAPRIEDVPHTVSPALGGLFGGLLGYAASRNAASGASGMGGTGGTNQAGAGDAGGLINSIIKAVTGNKPSTGGGSTTSGGSGTGSGNLGGMTGATSVIKTDASGDYVNTKTGETVEPMGNNLFKDSKGNTLDENGNQVFPNYGGGSGSTAITTDTGNTATSIGNGFYADQNNNVYDSNGTLVYQNPSIPNTGTQTEPSGGGYDSAQNQYLQDSSGDIYDGLGNLVLAFSNGYYYEPDTGNFYDNNFDPVNTDFNAYTDYFNIPTLDTSGYDNLGDYFDYGNYTSGSTTYIKDGGSVNKGGLPTPLFASGGNVKGYADGGTSFTDQVVANQMPQSVTTTSAPNTTSNTTGDTGNTSILNSLLNFATNNPAITGAGLGALLTSLINQNTTIPTNKGVDMTALGTLKPRTTIAGPARYVPYSEYGTPTAPYDYSTLYQNLGVSPFGGGAVSPSTPTSAAPTPTMPATTPTTPTGGLPAITAPTTPTTTTPTAPAMPTYFSDADGNIYDADGNLVYDTTSGSVSPSTVSAASPTTGTVMSSLPSTLAPTGAGDAYYSYGTPVTPASILSSKKGGLAVKKMADGGMTDLAVTSLYDATNPDYVSAHDALVVQPGMATMNNQFGTVGYNMGYNTPEASAFYDKYSVVSPDGTTSISPEGWAYLYGQDPNAYVDNSIVQDMPIDMPLAMGNVYDDSTDFPIRTMAGETPLPYERVTTTNAPSAPQPFSDSPTFRYSGARNPLLAGLPSTPTMPYVPQGYSLGGQPMTDNLNVPVSNRPFQNVPAVQGRGDYRTGAYVEGAGDGQSDDIPAMLADGEYVIDAETVAQLGNGSNKAGAKILDDFRKNIRAHKRSAPHDKIPPKSKSPLAYLKGAK
jgi:hypothetical protein